MQKNEENPSFDECQKFLAIMNTWIADEQFQRIQRYNQTRHWLDMQALQEANFSNFLTWILNPKEGHGLSDFFIKRLLVAASSCSDIQKECIDDWINRKCWLTLAELETMSFTRAYVAREVSILTNGNDNARMDLILIDPHNKLLLLIERKDGAKVAEGQLNKYAEWAEKNYPDFWHYWLVLDRLENNHIHINKDWIQLNDDWLTSAISDILDRDQLPETINRQLKEFKHVLTGDGQWSVDPYYQGCEEDIGDFAARFSADLKVLRDELKPFTCIDDKKAIAKTLPIIFHSQEDADVILRAIDLAACNHLVLAYLLNQNIFDDLKRQVTKDYQDKFTSEILRGRQYDCFNITLKRFKELEKWPMWLKIYETKDGDSGETKHMMKLEFDIRCNIGETIPHEIWKNKILAEYSPRINQRNIQTSKIEIQSLDIKSIQPLLNKLLEIEKKISG